MWLSFDFVEIVGDGGGGWLIDDTKNVEACESSSVFGGLPLGVVEVCKDERMRMIRGFGV
ncbi:hypothetical protein BDV98DRAFT_276684 [Pterulicium gracile]|uniref:Uncharacterized protein n=1 Tax=Pterulicium gracile TaxID=1884261 RepID=A0A5C3Q9X3_9AGAR|nr:hypothetical protein BDV98DRAFT_276684 [Pterula gracilis]